MKRDLYNLPSMIKIMAFTCDLPQTFYIALFFIDSKMGPLSDGRVLKYFF